MRNFTILQVGDLHFDDLRTSKPFIDGKDPGIPAHLRDAIAARPLQAVMKPMVEQLERADAVMVVGDLSSCGNGDVYVDAVKYLNGAFSLAEREPAMLHAVVGNHDVDRTLVEPGTHEPSEIFAKFRPLTTAWEKHSVPILAPESVRRTEILGEEVGLELFSMNSCIGCGEFRERAFDEKLEGELRARVAAGDRSARDSLFEQLDSPMFLDDHITEIAARVRDMSANHVPVVLAHHNLLPQFQPRLQIYTELVNAGAARARLASCDRPVIYLHGHIHDDPIEVIEQYHPHHGRLISISAPEVQCGFNMINVSFGQRHLPLGVTVVPWRYLNGEVRPEPSVRISLRRPDQENHEAASKILAVMDERGQLRYSNFLEHYRASYFESTTEEDLQQALIETEWSGRLLIDNRDQSPTQWILRTPLL